MEDKEWLDATVELLKYIKGTLSLVIAGMESIEPGSYKVDELIIPGRFKGTYVNLPGAIHNIMDDCYDVVRGINRLSKEIDGRLEELKSGN